MSGEERRGSRSRALERSLSYSEAIRGSTSTRSSIEIPNIGDTDVYYNEELKKHYRISQSYFDGNEVTFPVFSDDENKTVASEDVLTETDSQSEDEQGVKGLVMKIDVENDTDSPKMSSPTATVPISDVSTRTMISPPTSENIYESIERDESFYNTTTETSIPIGYSNYQPSTPYSRRKKRSTHRLRQGRPTRSRRVVLKTGEENVPVRSHIPAKSLKYMKDLVNTVINSKWRFILLMMVVAHFVFWFTFAGIWMLVTMSYQDIDGKDHCVNGTSSFAGLLMMAVETQMTIGYGTRFPNEECPEAIIVMVLEIVAGTALSGGLSSLLFTKLIRPNRHVVSVGFSKKATVCLRDGELCLQFRVWDLMNVHMIGSTITAYMLKPIRTLEGELVHNYIHQLKLKQATAFLLWPITVVHVIDQTSPLYDLSAQEMMDYRFEIVVCLTGSSKSMGTVTQSRTSYLSKEIIWGYRFRNVLNFSKKEDAYVVDTEHLNTVDEVETPLCSASHLKDFELRNSVPSPDSSMREDSQLSSVPSTLARSTPSTPALSRGGTQRSGGWSFRRQYPETVHE